MKYLDLSIPVKPIEPTIKLNNKIICIDVDNQDPKKIIERLQEKLEKMKCCGNCKHSKYGYVCSPENDEHFDCLNNSRWELKE